jgi:hypothetical protein
MQKTELQFVLFSNSTRTCWAAWHYRQWDEYIRVLAVLLWVTFVLKAETKTDKQ